jgi:hypothetical protein
MDIGLLLDALIMFCLLSKYRQGQDVPCSSTIGSIFNIIFADVKESFEAPRQKKKKSRDIEDEAVYHLAATKKLISE